MLWQGGDDTFVDKLLESGAGFLPGFGIVVFGFDPEEEVDGFLGLVERA